MRLSRCFSAPQVSVGGVLVPLRSAEELVPKGYLSRLPKALRPALKWLAQKAGSRVSIGFW